ncbi:LysR family transcriptional regulator [Caryophanon tenue]|uniref:LysR family transcriptional regulator n=1 Tax=Caryophanon tenue TaxID=33978 RepID=A0A1C0Y7D5_9BACL|nr:LysR family transcriptional regulator [Caryophanon tenue]OCS83089.1 LysR family transcriptional regulator [Caryophanon tenue]
MSLVKYQILSKVGQLGSFTKAADVLGLTQSAVSHAISSLEKEFGFPLIHRGRGGIKLTGDGEIMLVEIRKVLAAQESVEQEAANVLGFARGKVRIGVISSISSNWMPSIVQMMDESYPNIIVELMEGDYYEIEQWLYSGQIDCGFLNGMQNEQYRFHPLLKDQLLCLVSEKSPLFYEEVARIEDIAHQPFIMPSYNGTHDIKQLFEQANMKPNIRFELSEEMGILSMISHHIGITILPQLATQNNIPSNVKAIPLENNSYRTIGLATKQNISPATTKFMEVLQAWLGTHPYRL